MSKKTAIASVLGGIIGGPIQDAKDKKRKKKRRARNDAVRSERVRVAANKSGRALREGDAGGSLLGGRPGGATSGTVLGG